jgi:hypothetical protein
MALTLDAKTDRSCSLEEYVAYVAREVDLMDIDSVARSAPMLRALANNKGFLAESINREIIDWRNFQAQNIYTSPVFILAKGPGFAVRAFVWTTQHDPFHEIPHDHAFSLMTVGYWGSGYETLIYEYDRQRVVGRRDEPVELRFLERTTLPEGKVMFYRKFRDVHLQQPPRELSVSLNLIFDGTSRDTGFYFDLEAQKIAGSSGGLAVDGKLLLCDLARHLGDDTTASLLESLAPSHPSPPVRAAAFASLAALRPDSAREIWGRAAKDGDPMVRHAAAAALEGD